MPNPSETSRRKKPLNLLSWYRVTLTVAHQGAGKNTTVKNVFIFTENAYKAWDIAKKHIT